VSVAIPLRRWRKLSAVRSAVSSARSRPRTRSTAAPASTRWPSLASASRTHSASSARKTRAAAATPETTISSFATTSAEPRAPAGTHASAVRSPGPTSSSSASAIRRPTASSGRPRSRSLAPSAKRTPHRALRRADGRCLPPVLPRPPLAEVRPWPRLPGPRPVAARRSPLPTGRPFCFLAPPRVPFFAPFAAACRPSFPRAPTLLAFDALFFAPLTDLRRTSGLPVLPRVDFEAFRFAARFWALVATSAISSSFAMSLLLLLVLAVVVPRVALFVHALLRAGDAREVARQLVSLCLQFCRSRAILLHHFGRCARDESWIAQPLLDAEQIRLDLADLLLDPHFFRAEIDEAAERKVHLHFGLDVHGGVRRPLRAGSEHRHPRRVGELAEGGLVIAEGALYPCIARQEHDRHGLVGRQVHLAAHGAGALDGPGHQIHLALGDGVHLVAFAPRIVRDHDRRRMP